MGSGREPRLGNSLCQEAGPHLPCPSRVASGTQLDWGPPAPAPEDHSAKPWPGPEQGEADKQLAFLRRWGGGRVGRPETQGAKLPRLLPLAALNCSALLTGGGSVQGPLNPLSPFSAFSARGVGRHHQARPPLSCSCPHALSQEAG